MYMAWGLGAKGTAAGSSGREANCPPNPCLPATKQRPLAGALCPSCIEVEPCNQVPSMESEQSDRCHFWAEVVKKQVCLFYAFLSKS